MTRTEGSKAGMSEIQHVTPRRTGALFAGIALLAMAIITPLAIFGVIDNIAVAGDPAATAGNLREMAALVRLASAGLVVVVVLDVLVAWGLHVLLRRVNPSLSLLGAWFRIAYAAIFATAINDILSALRAAPVDPGQAALFVAAFDDGWQIGLILFGVHLVVVGGLVWRSPDMSRVLAVLVMLAGIGYLVDGFIEVLAISPGVSVSSFTFVGEVALMLWLLIRGSRLSERTRVQPGVEPPSGR